MYTKYQIAKVQNISLLDYVEGRGYELIYSHSDVRLKEHDSVILLVFVDLVYGNQRSKNNNDNY
ncbi:MAG: hypothetical protein K0R54_2566 [Clostridiaceae bacterium]|nr:hypothetical protein [Clostridiaceae bacterium]